MIFLCVNWVGSGLSVCVVIVGSEASSLNRKVVATDGVTLLCFAVRLLGEVLLSGLSTRTCTLDIAAARPKILSWMDVPPGDRNVPPGDTTSPVAFLSVDCTGAMFLSKSNPEVPYRFVYRFLVGSSLH